MRKLRVIIIKKRVLIVAAIAMLAIFIALISIFIIRGTQNVITGGEITTKAPKCKLAIVIDDFGQNRTGIEQIMSIPAHITFAIMPFLQYSTSDAMEAHKKGYEVIIHLSMEPLNGNIKALGPRPIMNSMGDVEVKAIVNDAIANVPFAVGANNHMGSKVTENTRIVSSVLDVMKQKNLYFVDSRTTQRTVIKDIADSMGVTCFKRDIFLDNQKNKEFIKKQLKLACDTAVEKGKAVAIGHVGVMGGKDTAESIREMLPEFDSRNVQLVYISEL